MDHEQQTCIRTIPAPRNLGDLEVSLWSTDRLLRMLRIVSDGDAFANIDPDLRDGVLALTIQAINLNGEALEAHADLADGAGIGSDLRENAAVYLTARAGRGQTGPKGRFNS